MSEQQYRRCTGLYLRSPGITCLVLILLARLQLFCSALSPFIAENELRDAGWVFSVASVGRMVPLLRRAEAATRLQNLITKGTSDNKRDTSVLLRSSPVSLLHKAALLQAAQKAFAGEERLRPGVFESHARTLLLVLHAASCAGRDPREVLRVALARAGLVTGVLDVGGQRGDSCSSSCRRSRLAADSWEAVASAEAFVSDVQRLAARSQPCAAIKPSE